MKRTRNDTLIEILPFSTGTNLEVKKYITVERYDFGYRRERCVTYRVLQAEFAYACKGYAYFLVEYSLDDVISDETYKAV